MHGAPGEGEGHHMPRWVKVLVIVGAVVGLLVLGLLVFGNGEHGPSRHFGGNSDGSSSNTESHTPPAGHGAKAASHAVGVGVPSWP